MCPLVVRSGVAVLNKKKKKGTSQRGQKKEGLQLNDAKCETGVR